MDNSVQIVWVLCGTWIATILIIGIGSYYGRKKK